VDHAPLLALFSEEEARCVARAMSPDSALGPDGIGPGFYAGAWTTTKPTIMRILRAFHDEQIDLQCINRALIVLIPKTEAAVTLSAFRPVSLQNCPVKILTKLPTSRLQQQISSLIDVDQTGFIRGRAISENFVLATVLVQCCHRRRAPSGGCRMRGAKTMKMLICMKI
jgi:hypothetical protein